jgi:hypothetical protein
MNWFVYLPPVVSITLILTSGRANLYFRHLIRSYNPEDQELTKLRPVIEDVALDWATRIGFFNSMFSSLFSCLSVYAGPQTFQFVIGTLAILLIIFIFLLYWILSYQPGELVTLTIKRLGNIRGTDLCSIFLILINVLLIVEIAAIQIMF